MRSIHLSLLYVYDIEIKLTAKRQSITVDLGALIAGKSSNKFQLFALDMAIIFRLVIQLAFANEQQKKNRTE